jgi:hypothetical protein
MTAGEEAFFQQEVGVRTEIHKKIQEFFLFGGGGGLGVCYVINKLVRATFLLITRSDLVHKIIFDFAFYESLVSGG